MKRSRFIVSKMDCPSEEQMIRMKLKALDQVKHLEFDLPGRQLDVFHSDNVEPILLDLLMSQSETKFPINANTETIIIH